MTSKRVKGHAALRSALLLKTGWSKQRLSQVVQQKHRQLPMTTRVAQSVVAHEHGLRLGQYLEGDELREAQETVSKLRPAAESGGSVGRRDARVTAKRSQSSGERVM